MGSIEINVYGLTLDAILIRESNPRLCICQDRVASLNDNNEVIDKIDLLQAFNKDGGINYALINQLG